NRAVTVRGGDADLVLRRLPGDEVLHIDGTVGPGGEALRIGVDDPAHHAAWRLKALLEARGVAVAGKVAVRYRPWRPSDDPEQRHGAPAARAPHVEPLARLTAQPLADTISITNKVSQNLYAELLLRRVGLVEGTGSVADGQARLRAMLEKAGVTPAEVELWDGSGMSTYNRATPRGSVKLLRWIAAQPWGAAWRATLPVAGVDGTLARRFRGTAAQGRLSAKTGTLNATNALAGYLTTARGRTLTVAIYANDVPSEARATPAMDAALALIAAEN
ncbi:MAG: D-alanyl-D-alanine carboxypeptidase/D-alanyl-D-alanine-endopeptidase, partial [Alphaproteobacteria bacterium]|nr:D-alanyl-D-alanine carboxypeptidase/D-alanyl-D-alanine-endopeptidase [Alphaproteobacteria bacterium]